MRGTALHRVYSVMIMSESRYIMGLNDTPVSDRFTIGIFGRRNAGKSSLINAITSQNIALTSDVAGTTTDPVSKTMEILPIGPVVIIDTAGLDDEGELGRQRVETSFEVLRKCHLVIFVCDAELGKAAFGELEEQFIWQLQRRKINCIVALNKCGDLPELARKARATDILTLAEDLKRTSDMSSLKDELREAGRVRALAASIRRRTKAPVICTDAVSKIGIEELKQAIIANSNYESDESTLTEGLISVGDLAVLVTPIDSAAPKGRMILPQQQVLRDILDKDATALVTKENSLSDALDSLKDKPTIVITDSQAFKSVAADVDESIPLTSFSILYARQKGDLETMLEGAKALGDLKPGDKILIAEGCTHHRQADDIGTVKIPRLVRQLQPDVEFEWKSGAVFPKDLKEYKLVIHCGACMLSKLEVQYRLDRSNEQGVPMTNYGMVIAYVTGILERAVKPFGLDINTNKEK